MDVCKNIISNPYHKTKEDVERQTLYVLNGEYAREFFHVPTYQVGNVESIFLVINPHNRTVSILRNGPYKSVSRGDNVSISFTALTN